MSCSTIDVLIFFAGSVLEEGVPRWWRSFVPDDRLRIRTALQLAISRRFILLPRLCGNKLVDAMVRVAEQAWPGEFSDLCDWLVAGLGQSSSFLGALHTLEALVIDFTSQRTRGRITVARRQELMHLTTK